MPTKTGNTCAILIDDVTALSPILETLRIGKASGPDCINNYVLKMCAVELSEPLSKLFNCSLSQAKVPIIWKEANVTPLFKKDGPSNYENYRPISLLSTIGKVLERVIHTYNFFLLQTMLQQHFSLTS